MLSDYRAKREQATAELEETAEETKKAAKKTSHTMRCPLS